MTAGRVVRAVVPTRPGRWWLGLPVWLWLGILIALGANVLAMCTVTWTGPVMRGTSAFAADVRGFDDEILAAYRIGASVVAGTLIAVYVWPVVGWFQRGAGTLPSPTVQRRVVGSPVALTAFGFLPWVLAIGVFPLRTWWHFGRWSPDLVSQEVLSPLVAGFCANAASYFLYDWMGRTLIVPHVFPHGRAADVPGRLRLGVRGQLLVFLLAVGFAPVFTMLGLLQAAVARLKAGFPVDVVTATLTVAGWTTFGVFSLLGMALSLVFGRTLTRPLRHMAATLRRVRAGDLRTGVRPTAADEIGLLEDGVNDLVRTLEDRERILATFGRIVEPAVRDRLLDGTLAATGEERVATILFCDLRGFTGTAEHQPPAEVVATLNEFFTLAAGWARGCGGFVDKFLGDAMMVVFGLFDPLHDGGAAGAAAAVRCARGFGEKLAALNVRRAAAGRPPLAAGIGCDTGAVLAGTIGAADRHEYTVIGDPVNVAARLQERARDEGIELLVSARTWRLAVAGGAAEAATTTEPVEVRGRREPVHVVRFARRAAAG